MNKNRRIFPKDKENEPKRKKKRTNDIVDNDK